MRHLCSSFLEFAFCMCRGGATVLLAGARRWYLQVSHSGTVFMSTTADLVTAIKKELKATQMTYAGLAVALGMAESSVKRMLAKGDMPLSRIDAICRALKLDFAELARRVADAQPLMTELTQEQERAVVGDKKLLLVALSVLSLWTLEQIIGTYRL